LLLLVEANNHKKCGIIPGKLFEYLMAKRPIVAIGPKDWDVEQIIDETKAGKVFNYQNQASLKEQINLYFNSFLKGKLNVNTKDISHYSRKNLTEKLSKHII
jgi:hypothetical protein